MIIFHCIVRCFHDVTIRLKNRYAVMIFFFFFFCCCDYLLNIWKCLQQIRMKLYSDSKYRHLWAINDLFHQIFWNLTQITFSSNTLRLLRSNVYGNALRLSSIKIRSCEHCEHVIFFFFSIGNKVRNVISVYYDTSYAYDQ